VTGRSSWAVLAMTALVAASTLTGCGLGGFGRKECTPETDAVVQRLQKSPILDLLPPGATAQEIYATRPCDDEDNLGSVGRQLTSTQQDSELLAYFRDEFPKTGWVLKHERAESGRQLDGLHVGEPDQCYESPAEPNVTLEVMLGLGPNPDTDFFVSFHFTGHTYSCASTTPPPMTR
jgi:hypothetical protein